MRTFQLESPIYRTVSAYRAVTIDKVRKLQAGQRILDVGASYGAFAEYVRTSRQAEAWAIDLDPGSIDNFVNTDDIDVRCGDLLDARYPDDHFDVVTLFETLEHVYEPVETLREARRILKPGGLVSIEVPSWDSLWRPIFGRAWMPLLLPTHLQHFSRATLRRCAEEAGLKVVHHQSMLYPVEMTFSLFIALSARLPTAEHSDTGLARRALQTLAGLIAAFLILFIDLPIMFWLRIFHRAGHQTLVAQKATPLRLPPLRLPPLPG
jgi:2-polyprenyl-3-methyl-5-hydroxy-6-metoxy-1,4-benzoquinol methylase